MRQPQRRTKIIATVGPAIANPAIMEKAILAGVSVFRLNFSHGALIEHEQSVNQLRHVAARLEREIAIMADLQGPKIRIARFRDKQIKLESGDNFVIDVALDDNDGDQQHVGCDYKDLIHDVRPGDKLLLDDGRLIFQVEAVVGSKINCRVEVGGILSNHKGINRLGGGLSAPALTDKDKIDLAAAVKFGVDYIAVSFPRDAADIHEAQRLIQAAGGQANVIAKIERVEALANIDDIITAADAVMVARGDLAVEIGDAEVPAAQKLIIQRARSLNKIVITATQMMESMIHSPVPTRAEVSDVANAVLDGTDAVMLSAETAVGSYPIEAIAAMDRVCLSAEKNPVTQKSQHRMECHFERADEAIAMATMYTANHMNIDAIVSLTESGTTPLLMSRIRSGIPIIALTRHCATARKLCLFRGVYPVSYDFTQFQSNELDRKIADLLVTKQVLYPQESIVITKGDRVGVHGYTDCMKIYRV